MHCTAYILHKNVRMSVVSNNFFRPQVWKVRFSDHSGFFFSVFRPEKWSAKINSCEVCMPTGNDFRTSLFRAVTYNLLRDGPGFQLYIYETYENSHVAS